MREIRYTSRFKRDYKREKSGRHGKTLDAALMDVVTEAMGPGFEVLKFGQPHPSTSADLRL